VLATAQGKAIHFDEKAARPMGRQAHGVRGIRLLGDDRVVGMVVAHDPDATIFTACENGYGKRTPVGDYPIKNRGGQGVINIKTGGRNGLVVGMGLATEQDDVLFITESGMIVRSPASDMRPMGRGTMGVRLVNLKDADRLVATEIVTKEDLETFEAMATPRRAPPLVSEALGEGEVADDPDSEPEEDELDDLDLDGDEADPGESADEE
jgi:DNA gyrase subunit A